MAESTLEATAAIERFQAAGWIIHATHNQKTWMVTYAKPLHGVGSVEAPELKDALISIGDRVRINVRSTFHPQ